MDAQALVVCCPMGGSARLGLYQRIEGSMDLSWLMWRHMSSLCQRVSVLELTVFARVGRRSVVAPVESDDTQACRLSHGKNGLAVHGQETTRLMSI